MLVTNCRIFQKHFAVLIQSRYIQSARRAFPQYNIYGESTALAIRPIPPQFKLVGTDGITLDKKGLLSLEFSPRNRVGKGYDWNSNQRFAITVEEMGLLLSQLPYNPVELSRQEKSSPFDSIELSSNLNSGSRVLTWNPNENAEILVVLNKTQDGSSLLSFPMEINLMPGEWEVVRSIMQESIPFLLGWRKMLDISLENSLTNLKPQPF